MSDLQIRRSDATRRVMKALARLSVYEPLPVRLEDGTTPIVVALPDELVKDMVDRLQRAGGRANVVIDYPEHFTVADFECNEIKRAVAGSPADVHHKSTVGMLIDLLRLQPEGKGEFTMRMDSGVSLVETPVVREHEYQF